MKSIAVIAAICSCALLPSFASATLTAQEVYSKASPSVVVVIAFDSQGKSFGSGSGVAVEKGRVVTNWHVVENASSLLVKRRGSNYKANLVSDRRERDLAVLDVPGLDAPIAKQISIKSLTVGQPVYAIGAPSGLELTLTNGLVSALRDIGDGKLIQTSAAISPGSSGGGLFDDQGQLIGITTLKLTGKAQEGLGFAVPVDWVRELVSPDQKSQDGSSGWIWIVGVLPLMLAIFFGKRVIIYLLDRFSANEIPYNSNADTDQLIETDASEHKPSEKELTPELAKFAMTARNELLHGNVDQTVYKQAQAFAIDDLVLVDQLYIKLRAATLHDAATQMKSHNVIAGESQGRYDQKETTQFQHTLAKPKKRMLTYATLFVVVVSVLSAAPWISGILIERYIQSLVSETGTSDVAIMKTTITSYSRGWLKSMFITTHSLKGAAGNDASFRIRHTLNHIPQWKDGAAITVTSNPIFETSSFFKDSEINGKSRLYVNGKIASTIAFQDVGAKSLPDDASTVVSFRGAKIELERSAKEKPTSFSLKVEGASIAGKEFKTGLSDLALYLNDLEILQNKRSLDLTLALSIGSALLDLPEKGSQFRLTGVSYSQEQRREADLLNGAVKLTANDLWLHDNSGTDFRVKDSSLSFSIERLSASALSDWETLSKNSKGENSQVTLAAVLPYILKNSPSISDAEAKFTVKTPEVAGNFSLNANLSIDTQGLIPETATLKDYQDRIKVSGKLSGSTSMLSSFFEFGARQTKEREVKAALSQGKQLSEEEAKAHVAKAKTEAEELMSELSKEGLLITSGNQYATNIDYADKHWTINGIKGDQHVAELMEALKESKSVTAKSQTESPMNRAIRSNNELRSQPYANQIKTIKQWVQAGKISTSSFSPMVFHEAGLMRAVLQRNQIRDAPATVNNALRDREIWWMDETGFHLYLANITNETLTGIAYQLDLGGDCQGQPKGPFLYFPIQIDPPLQPAGARVVNMPRQVEIYRQAAGKMICGTLVTVW